MLIFNKKLLNGIVLPAFLATSVNFGEYGGVLAKSPVLENHFAKDDPTVIKDLGKKKSKFYELQKNARNETYENKKNNKPIDFWENIKNFFRKNGLYLALAGTSGFISPFLIRSLVLSDADNAQSPEKESKHFKRSSNNEENKNSNSEENVNSEQEITKTPTVQNDPESNISVSSSVHTKDKKVKQEAKENVEENVAKGIFTNLLVVGFVAVYLVCNKVKNKITIKPGLYNYDPERIAKELQYNIFTEKVMKKGVYLPKFEGDNIYKAESVDFNFCTYEELLSEIYKLYTTHKSYKSKVDFKSRIEKLFLLKFPENYEKIKIGINLLLPGTILENSYTRTAPDVLESALEFLSGLSNLKNLSDKVRSWLKHRIAGIELYKKILIKIFEDIEKNKEQKTNFSETANTVVLYKETYGLPQNIDVDTLRRILNTMKSEFKTNSKDDKKLPIYHALVDDIIFFILEKKDLTNYVKENGGENFHYHQGTKTRIFPSYEKRRDGDGKKLCMSFHIEPFDEPHRNIFLETKYDMEDKLEFLCKIFSEENNKENLNKISINEGMKENNTD